MKARTRDARLLQLYAPALPGGTRVLRALRTLSASDSAESGSYHTTSSSCNTSFKASVRLATIGRSLAKYSNTFIGEVYRIESTFLVVPITSSTSAALSQSGISRGGRTPMQWRLG